MPPIITTEKQSPFVVRWPSAQRPVRGQHPIRVDSSPCPFCSGSALCMGNCQGVSPK